MLNDIGSGFRRSSASGFTLLEAVVVLFILAVLAGLVMVAVGDVSGRASRDTTLASMTELRNAITSRYYADVGEWPYTVSDLFRSRKSPLPEVADLSNPPVPAPARGWRGPYVQGLGASYAPDLANKFVEEYGPSLPSLGSPPAVKDGWGRSLVLQIPNSKLVEEPAGSGIYVLKSLVETSPGSGLYVEAPLRPDDVRHARLVSAGPDGLLSTPRLDADVLGPPLVPGDLKAWFPPLEERGDDLLLYLRVVDRRQ